MAQAPSASLQLEHAEDLPSATATDLMNAFSQAVAEHAGAPLRLEIGPWPDCPDRVECLQEWSVLGTSDSLVLISAFGGLSRLRIVAERIQRGKDSGPRVVGDVPMASGQWGPGLSSLAQRLFQPGELVASPLAIVPTVEPSPTAMPWVLGGLAVAGAAVAVGLAISSESARNELPDTLLSSGAYGPLRDRAEGHAYAALAVGSGAIACGVLAIAWSFLE